MLYLAIPAHNEVATIGVLLWRIRTVLAEFPREYEVVVYDDASTDETVEVARQYERAMPVTVLRGERHLGYAGALDALLRHVAQRTRYPRRDAVLIMQGDFTDPPGIVPEFARRFEGGADLVVGERLVVADAPTAVRRLFRGAHWAMRPFVRVEGVKDLTASMRLVRITALREAIRTAGDTPLVTGDTWTANADVLLRLAPHARRIESVPLEPTYGVRTRETRRVAMRDALSAFKWAWGARGRRAVVGSKAEAGPDERRGRGGAGRRQEEPELSVDRLREKIRDRDGSSGLERDTDTRSGRRGRTGQRDSQRTASSAASTRSTGGAPSGSSSGTPVGAPSDERSPRSRRERTERSREDKNRDDLRAASSGEGAAREALIDRDPNTRHDHKPPRRSTEPPPDLGAETAADPAFGRGDDRTPDERDASATQRPAKRGRTERAPRVRREEPSPAAEAMDALAFADPFARPSPRVDALTRVLDAGAAPRTPTTPPGSAAASAAASASESAVPAEPTAASADQATPPATRVDTPDATGQAGEPASPDSAPKRRYRTAAQESQETAAFDDIDLEEDREADLNEVDLDEAEGSEGDDDAAGDEEAGESGAPRRKRRRNRRSRRGRRRREGAAEEAAEGTADASDEAPDAASNDGAPEDRSGRAAYRENDQSDDPTDSVSDDTSDDTLGDLSGDLSDDDVDALEAMAGEEPSPMRARRRGRRGRRGGARRSKGRRDRDRPGNPEDSPG